MSKASVGKTTSSVMEVVKAAVLANHTAASLLTALRKSGGGGFELCKLGEAARIMRSAEALSRSAVGFLAVDTSMKKGDKGGIVAGHPVASGAKSVDGGGGGRAPASTSR
eukprot:10121650-Karenia_brevis.AAC.1